MSNKIEELLTDVFSAFQDLRKVVEAEHGSVKLSFDGLSDGTSHPIVERAADTQIFLLELMDQLPGHYIGKWQDIESSKPEVESEVIASIKGDIRKFACLRYGGDCLETGEDIWYWQNSDNRCRLTVTKWLPVPE